MALLFALQLNSDAVNALRITTDDKRVVSASSDKNIRIFELDTKKLLMTVKNADCMSKICPTLILIFTTFISSYLFSCFGR